MHHQRGSRWSCWSRASLWRPADQRAAQLRVQQATGDHLPFAPDGDRATGLRCSRSGGVPLSPWRVVFSNEALATSGRRCLWRQGTKKGCRQERGGATMAGCQWTTLRSVTVFLHREWKRDPGRSTPARLRAHQNTLLRLRLRVGPRQWGTACASRPFHKADQGGCSHSCGPFKMTFVTNTSKRVAASSPAPVVGVTREPRAARWSAGGWAS